MTFFAISLSSLLGKGSDPSFKQTWIPITSGCFVPNLFEIGLEFWRTRFLNFFNLFRYFRYFVPLKKGGLLCKQTWILITQECIVFMFDWILSSGSGEEMKMWIVYLQTDGRKTDRRDWQQTIRKIQFSFQLN